MSRSDQQRIDDILGAAEELAVIVARGKAKFDNDTILRRAAERLLEIIGEAANHSVKARRVLIRGFPGAMSRVCGSCWHTTTTASTLIKCGR